MSHSELRPGLDRDGEMAIRILARRNRLFGQWAAEKMKLTPAEAETYAKGVVQGEFEEMGDDEDLIRKILNDFFKAGLELSLSEVRDALDAKEIEARRALMGKV